MNRRMALKQMSGLMSAVLFGSAAAKASTSAEVFEGQTPAAATPASPAPTGPYTLPPLPYAYDALEPYFDAETMHLHHDKHHQSYVDKLNIAVASQLPQGGANPVAKWKDVNDLVANLDDVPESIRTAVRNQGGGHANHSFWWTSLAKPGSGGSAPTGELAKAIDAKFGSLSGFQEKLTAAGSGVFGSGWAWLVAVPGSALEIQTTPNQDSPLTVGHTPILGIDVWEHAYYLKYKNKRPDYIKAYFSVVNWDAASQKFASLKKS